MSVPLAIGRPDYQIFVVVLLWLPVEVITVLIVKTNHLMPKLVIVEQV